MIFTSTLQASRRFFLFPAQFSVMLLSSLRWRICGTWWRWSGHPAQHSKPARTSLTWCLSAGSVRETGVPGTASCYPKKRFQLTCRWRTSTRSVHVQHLHLRHKSMFNNECSCYLSSCYRHAVIGSKSQDRVVETSDCHPKNTDFVVTTSN